MVKKEIIALICCRGGSKGIPNKNIKPFCGKPLLSWTLENAKKANVFDKIILSTDSKDIAEIGKNNGALIPGLRPKYLSTASSNVFDTHKYIFNKLNINDEGFGVCILTNNPFITAELIQAGYKISKSNLFNSIALDSLEIGGDYLHFRHCYKKDGRLFFKFPKDMQSSGINRQSYQKKIYTSISNMRWGKPSFMIDYNAYKKEIIQNGTLPIPLSKLHNFDLDDLDDWSIAESVFKGIFL